MAWKKINEDTLVNMPETKDLETIKIPVLEAEISELESRLDSPEPSDKELLEWAKVNHPSFSDKLWAQHRMEELRKISMETEHGYYWKGNVI